MAGNLSLTLETGLTIDGAQFPIPTTITYGTLVKCGLTLAANTSAQEVSAAFAYGKIVAYLLWCDRACTLKTNDSGTPDDTIALTANTAKVFRTGVGDSEFTADVTKIYAVQGSGSATASLKLFVFLET